MTDGERPNHSTPPPSGGAGAGAFDKVKVAIRVRPFNRRGKFLCLMFSQPRKHLRQPCSTLCVSRKCVEICKDCKLLTLWRRSFHFSRPGSCLCNMFAILTGSFVTLVRDIHTLVSFICPDERHRVCVCYQETGSSHLVCHLGCPLGVFAMLGNWSTGRKCRALSFCTCHGRAWLCEHLFRRLLVRIYIHRE